MHICTLGNIKGTFTSTTVRVYFLQVEKYTATEFECHVLSNEELCSAGDGLGVVMIASLVCLQGSSPDILWGNTCPYI